MYREIIADRGLKQEHQQKSCKKYLKQLIRENINHVKFVKSLRVNEPDRICSESAGEHALDMTIQQCATETYNDISNAAKIIRNELKTIAKWNFQSLFSNFSSLMQLSTLLQWIIFGPVNALENKAKQR